MLIKNCFQTSTTSTLLATAEPAMTTTVAFAGASFGFDHQHGDDRDDGHDFGDKLLHLISQQRLICSGTSNASDGGVAITTWRHLNIVDPLH